MKSVPETITPKKAAEWMTHNEGNRPMRKNHVTKLSEAIKRDEWKLNGESIKFNCNGRLIDGQHRLQAIILSGRSIQSYVVRGLPNDAFDSIDQGAARGLSDVFARNGEVNCALLAGAVRWYGILADRKNFKNGYTPAQAKETIEKNPELRASVKRFAANRNLKGLMHGSIAAALHYLFSRKDQTLADLFFDGLFSGEGLRKSDPVYLLRERLIGNMGSVAKLGRETIAALTVKAWNATRTKTPLKTLKWVEESIPEIK